MSIAMNTSTKSQRGTLSQNNNFIRPAFGDYFIIESEVQRFGSTIAIGETKIYSEESRDVLCHATSTYPLKFLNIISNIPLILNVGFPNAIAWIAWTIATFADAVFLGYLGTEAIWKCLC